MQIKAFLSYPQGIFTTNISQRYHFLSTSKLVPSFRTGSYACNFASCCEAVLSATTPLTTRYMLLDLCRLCSGCMIRGVPLEKPSTEPQPHPVYGLPPHPQDSARHRRSLVTTYSALAPQSPLCLDPLLTTDSKAMNLLHFRWKASGAWSFQPDFWDTSR